MGEEAYAMFSSSSVEEVYFSAKAKYDTLEKGRKYCFLGSSLDAHIITSLNLGFPYCTALNSLSTLVLESAHNTAQEYVSPHTFIWASVRLAFLQHRVS